MKKNQIVGIIITLVIIFFGILVWSFLKKEKPSLEKVAPKEKEEVKEVFTLSGIVLSVDAENNFLIVKPIEKEKEIKVILSETTKLIKLEFPFNPKRPPKEADFVPKQTEIKISDFKTGDKVFIKTKRNIFGKDEFNDIDFIHLLP